MEPFSWGDLHLVRQHFNQITKMYGRKLPPWLDVGILLLMPMQVAMTWRRVYGKFPFNSY